MKILNKFLPGLMLIASLISCKEPSVLPVEPVHHTFFLRHKGADMPIWVHGNAQSNKIVLYLHGGPGDCAMCYRYYFKTLEQDMMVAYWDQRVAGSSSGKVNPSTLRYEQFSEDAFYAIKLLKQQYPNAHIYLLAHSFGVELAWQFLSTGQNQKMVAGLMAVNGMFSYYRWLYQVREWALREAKLQKNTAAERDLLNNPVTPENTATVDWELIYRWMHKLGGNPVSLYDDKKYLFNYAFASPNTALAQFTHSKAYSYYGEVESRLFEKGTVLKDIQLPVRLFWGVKDGVVPVEVGRETQQLLTGTAAHMVEFKASWHEPFITETEAFNQAVKDFVEKY